MRTIKSFISIFLCATLLASCEYLEPIDPDTPNENVDPTDPQNPEDPNKPVDPNKPEDPTDPNSPYKPADPLPGEASLDRVFDMDNISEITLEFSLEQWNELLSIYDANNKTKDYVHCDVTFNSKATGTKRFTDAGVRLRGNTSRRRPEEGNGAHVGGGNANWKHCHFGLNLRKFQKDDVHEIDGIRKFNLKWFNNDPSYIRETFCFDLFRRAGVWTAARVSYARLWIKVEGDPAPAYYGVYAMEEPYDNKYLSRKIERFSDDLGNLWKCCYTSNGPADLRSENANFGLEDGIHEYTYELKETDDTFDNAKAQLVDFIKKLNGKGDESFKKWIQEVCDVPLLIRTYAVNVAVGMWDDHWNNGNNYYLYFNSKDMYNYKVFFIPYDYDNTLGTSNTYDPAKQNPTQWGNMGKLMQRIMNIPEFKQMYIAELKALVNPSNGLMDYQSATKRIEEWQNRIAAFVSNDTGEDMQIKDETASWSNYHYKVLGNSNNYFIEKAKSINNL